MFTEDAEKWLGENGLHAGFFLGFTKDEYQKLVKYFGEDLNPKDLHDFILEEISVIGGA